jgi:hypothetical protein
MTPHERKDMPWIVGLSIFAVVSFGVFAVISVLIHIAANQ